MNSNMCFIVEDAASHPHDSKEVQPPQPATSRSCALDSKAVATETKFPNVEREYIKARVSSIGSMVGSLPPCSEEVPDDVVKLITQHLLERVLTVVEDYSYNTEAGIVQLLREVGVFAVPRLCTLIRCMRMTCALNVHLLSPC